MMISNVSISIKNFKSVKSKSLVLSSNGMTLIKGPSGAGKSTIIESVLYAIAGKPKSCKPLGTRVATSVSLSFDTAGESWTITRSTKPGRLLLERKGMESVEDDEAQALIHTIFGDKFEVVSYIPQNTGQSFMKMAPTEKLNFLEELSFGPDVAKFKKKAKAYLAEKKTDATKASAKHSLRFSDLSKVKAPTREEESLPRKPECDIDAPSLKSSARILKRKAQDQIESATSLIKSMQTAKNRRDADRLHLQTLEEEKKKLEEELDVEGNIEEHLENSKDAFLAAKKMQALVRELPAWAQGEDWETKDQQFLNQTKKELEEVRREMKKVEDEDTVYFDCPSCNNHIGYNRTTSEAVVGGRERSEKSESSLLDLLQQESKLNMKLEDRTNKGIAALDVHKKISALVEEWGEGALDDRDELEDTYGEMKELVDKSSRVKKLRKRVREAADPEFDKRVEELEADVKKGKKDLSKHQKAFDKADAILDKINAWHRNVDEIERRNGTIKRERLAYNEAVKTEAKAAVDLLASSKMLKGAEELKAAVLEAESLALVTLVSEINESAAGYLDAFFAEDPIEVSINTFSQVKSTKKIKPSIKTEIQYKGNDITLDALSGGEQARVIIAFTLALGDIRQSPIVMLDEVTANLDADLAETIFETVASATTGKVVMAVAHQCVDGIFENIVKF
jgi:DNA repair exonuclease SbcCD ATPase subunit